MAISPPVRTLQEQVVAGSGNKLVIHPSAISELGGYGGLPKPPLDDEIVYFSFPSPLTPTHQRVWRGGKAFHHPQNAGARRVQGSSQNE